jgi:hypothetical protein
MNLTCSCIALIRRDGAFNEAKDSSLFLPLLEYYAIIVAPAYLVSFSVLGIALVEGRGEVSVGHTPAQNPASLHKSFLRLAKL